jgi:hypothetical protein
MRAALLAIDWSLVRVGLILIGIGICAVIIETAVMQLFRLNRFGKSFVDSIMANIGSLLLAILLFLVFNKREFDISQVSELVILYCITSVFEACLIRLLNPHIGWPRLILTSFVMNLLSFAALYFVFTRVLAQFFSL